LALLAPGGIYLIDDMLPQPAWPPNHAPNVSRLLDALDRTEGLEVVKLTWSTGVVLAVNRE
jgi:hypothetical protein